MSLERRNGVGKDIPDTVANFENCNRLAAEMLCASYRRRPISASQNDNPRPVVQ